MPSTVSLSPPNMSINVRTSDEIRRIAVMNASGERKAFWGPVVIFDPELSVKYLGECYESEQSF